MTTESETATIEEPPRVIHVLEGVSLNTDRLFAVVLNRCAGEDLGVVAAAVPTPGSPHPTLAGFVARPPEIFCVGLRDKEGGAMLATATNFYNVRVRYEEGKASDLRPQTSGTAEEETAGAPLGEALAVPACPAGEACSLKPGASAPEGSPP